MTKEQAVIWSGKRSHIQWDTYVEKSPYASVSHLSCWQRIVSDTYGHRTFYLMHCRGTEILGILPLTWVHGGLLGNALCSMPFLDYAGICADNEKAAEALVKKALEIRDSCKAQYLELRHKNASDYGGIIQQDKVDMLLDLTGGQDAIWKSLAPKVRNQVRKASKTGLRTQVGGPEYLDQFYKILSINMRDLGSPVHSPAFFTNIFSEFGNRARIVKVCDGQKTVGALLCLFFRGRAFVPWASSLREYFPRCPNNLLYWDAIQYACENGYKHFHFGRSSIGSGTYKFKRQWGAQENRLNWEFFYRQQNQTHTPISENAKYQLAAQLWKRLPLSLTLLLGPHIRKYLTN